MINKSTWRDGKKSLNNYSEKYLKENACKLPGRQKSEVHKRYRELPSVLLPKSRQANTVTHHSFGNGHKTQTAVEQYKISTSLTSSI